jgi:hypothetical protein
MRLETQWTEAARQLRRSLAPGSKMMFAAARREVTTAIAGARRIVKFTGASLDVRL